MVPCGTILSERKCKRLFEVFLVNIMHFLGRSGATPVLSGVEGKNLVVCSQMADDNGILRTVLYPVLVGQDKGASTGLPTVAQNDKSGNVDFKCNCPIAIGKTKRSLGVK